MNILTSEYSFIYRVWESEVLQRMIYRLVEMGRLCCLSFFSSSRYINIILSFPCVIYGQVQTSSSSSNHYYYYYYDVIIIIIIIIM